MTILQLLDRLPQRCADETLVLDECRRQRWSTAMVPIIWSAVAEDATHPILDWIEQLLAFSGGAFENAAFSEGLDATRLREAHDALYEAFQALGVYNS
eukprot:6245533-Pyramimonas_sp.AAC.1